MFKISNFRFKIGLRLLVFGLGFSAPKIIEPKTKSQRPKANLKSETLNLKSDSGHRCFANSSPSLNFGICGAFAIFIPIASAISAS